MAWRTRRLRRFGGAPSLPWGTSCWCSGGPPRAMRARTPRACCCGRTGWAACTPFPSRARRQSSKGAQVKHRTCAGHSTRFSLAAWRGPNRRSVAWGCPWAQTSGTCRLRQVERQMTPACKCGCTRRRSRGGCVCRPTAQRWLTAPASPVLPPPREPCHPSSPSARTSSCMEACSSKAQMHWGLFCSETRGCSTRCWARGGVWLDVPLRSRPTSPLPATSPN